MELREPDELVAALRDSGSVFPERELAELQRAARIDDPWAIEMMVERRTLGEPIEHIVGSARFAELRVAVHPGVFVPRRRTELLATIVADRLRELADATAVREPGATRTPRLLDLGCGTGAIAALALHRVPGIRVVAIDADPAAVACARENLPGALVVLGDGIDALDRLDPRVVDAAGADASAPFDVIAANLPYVPTAQLALLPHDATEHEPLLALDGGSDGLDPLAEHAPAMLRRLLPGGIAVVEVARHQLETATALLRDSGFTACDARTDDALGVTAIVATR
ncbi:HemK/PrmC family methyltransferase [Agrococcus sp. HG114]|uniref:N5-glutamine methyltransferase family protein n=1 Tax=Agrococcus sp. HG114 TaxID=2969757 RepID=UPI00215AA80F|nr:HemK/PrmC family methyltransferase [Agrococcus sp. HG114]MCR8670622.1 peptide chain release factor N(5)-glutamine methyltransferase [Agrococcus sp. HG114]